MIEEFGLAGVGKVTAGVDRVNPCLGVTVQAAYDAGDKRESNIIPLEGLHCLLERLDDLVRVLRVVPVLIRGGGGGRS